MEGLKAQSVENRTAQTRRVEERNTKAARVRAGNSKSWND